MQDFSEYEERMIGFLMGHGMAADEAEQAVADERIDQFNDINHQLTEENQRRGDLNPGPRLIKIPNDPDMDRKVMAFRMHIGEDLWRVLGGYHVNERLLALAIDFTFSK